MNDFINLGRCSSSHLNMMIKFARLSVFVIFMTATSCRHDPVVPLTPQISFRDDITPIVIGNCAQSGCHSSGREGFDLLNYREVMNHVSAGQPYGSKLFTRMEINGPNVMPPNSPLPDEQVKLVYIWILQGARDN